MDQSSNGTFWQGMLGLLDMVIRIIGQKVKTGKELWAKQLT